jgi:heat shock protein HtpX
VGTVAATVAGAIAMIANIVKFGAICGGDRNEGGNPLAMLAVAIVAPIAAMIIQFAISRQNEYQADATAARITGRPEDLAGALRRLDAYAQRIPMQVNPAAAQLAIVNPLRGAGAMRMFSTHPATEDRVERLQQLSRDPQFQPLAG